MERSSVLIGIQARTNSTRLPNKSMKRIMGSSIVDRVIDLCLSSSRYINKNTHKHGMESEVFVLVPENDPLKEYLSRRKNITVLEGPENDLVTRYSMAVKELQPDYIVRITADCPLLPDYLIYKCINAMIRNGHEFLETSNPTYRTYYDGADVEIMSRKVFDWVNENSIEREHVCNDLRNSPPEWMQEGKKFGHVFSRIDWSSIKLSVDTQKDFELVENQVKSVDNKIKKWEEKYGKYTAYKF